MMLYSNEELENMDLETAKTEISNKVYEVTRLFESLETKGKILGNGHHIRQRIAVVAAQEMVRAWK